MDPHSKNSPFRDSFKIDKHNLDPDPTKFNVFVSTTLFAMFIHFNKRTSFYFYIEILPPVGLALIFLLTGSK